MVSTRRSGNTEHSGISLRAAASQRQQERQARARMRRDAAVESRAAARDGALPGVYRDMLIEAGVASPASRQPRNPDSSSEPPVKRLKRPGQKSEVPTRGDTRQPFAANARVDDDDNDDDDDGEDEEEDIEFEDILIPEPVIQTADLDSEDEEEDDEEAGDDEQLIFEDVNLVGAPTRQSDGVGELSQQEEEPRTLELNLTAHESSLTTPSRRGRGKAPANRKKPLSRAERIRRVDIHKIHVLCLLAHAARRNRWCNSEKVRASLRPLLTEKMITYLNPGSHLSQFGQTESLKNGLQQAATIFKTRFTITERGLRRALWAEIPEQLKDYELPTDIESVLDKDDFIEAAKSLGGSRDVGTQLFCALLRTAGVEARLVCSLQPLSFLTSAPTLPKSRGSKAPPSRSINPIPSIYQSPPTQIGSGDLETQAAMNSPLRRLGHPNASAYNIPPVATPPRRKPAPSSSAPVAHVVRGESAFPVYWVEVLDVAHQKWQPIDPLVTSTQWRPGKLEPPASDKNNQLCYAIGFSDDGSAKDVTRRYAKAYNAKTKRGRVDGLVEPATTTTATASSPSANLVGSKWLRRALRHYRQSYPTDVDQIEDTELASYEAREPMPRNVADFQNHPVYALGRHLRRHEVLIPKATAVGTVSAGAKAPLERIYRRRDVRVAYSADRWYRLGRLVNSREIPAKWLPKPVSRKKGLFADDDTDEDDSRGGGIHDDVSDLFGDNDDDGAGPIGQHHPTPSGTPIFTPEQTELYRAPPVVNGRVPKNKFGNIDVYVPSMVPEGGEHVVEEGAARAAFLLGVDYAPALTGFRFEGRRGTAVLRGAVVAAEYADAVRAVIDGLQDLEAEAEAERRTRAALRVWAAFLRGLRIRERIRAAAEDRGEDVSEGDEDVAGVSATGASNVVEEMDNQTTDEEGPAIEDAKSDVTEEYDMVVDDDDEDLGGGGFMLE